MSHSRPGPPTRRLFHLGFVGDVADGWGQAPAQVCSFSGGFAPTPQPPLLDAAYRTVSVARERSIERLFLDRNARGTAS